MFSFLSGTLSMAFAGVAIDRLIWYAAKDDLSKPTKKIVAKILYSVFITAACSFILPFLFSPAWVQPAALPLNTGFGLIHCIFGTCFLTFITLSIFVEWRNQGNNFTAKKRFLKYTFQEAALSMSAFLICCFLTSAINSMNSEIRTLSNGWWLLTLSALLSSLIGSHKAIRATKNLYWTCRTPKLKPNSKALKALRKSPY